MAPTQEDIMRQVDLIEHFKRERMDVRDPVKFNKMITQAIRNVNPLMCAKTRSGLQIKPIREVGEFKRAANDFYDRRIRRLTVDDTLTDDGWKKIKYLANDDDDFTTDLAASSLIKVFPSATVADVKHVCRWTPPGMDYTYGGWKVSDVMSATYAVFYPTEAERVGTDAVLALVAALRAAKRTVPKTVAPKRAGEDVAPNAKRPCL